MLEGHAPQPIAAHAPASPSLQDILSGIGFTLITVLVALLIILPRRAPASAKPVARELHRLQSGHIGDYVAWLTFGAAAVLAALVFALS